MKLSLGILWGGLILLYVQVIYFDPLNYDDPSFLQHHPAASLSLRSFSFWQTLFGSYTVNLWHPLTDLSHQLLYRLSTKPALHLSFNVLLHGITSSLWLILFRKFTHSPILALLLTLLFAWHPVTVESTAWISGRKDLLCILFLTLCVSRYHKSHTLNLPPISPLLIIWALCAFLAKPIAITLPFLLLSLDYWPHRSEKKLRQLILEKWPFWLLSLCSIFITIYGQSIGTQATSDGRSLFIRLAESFWAFQHGFLNCLIPSKLHLAYSNPYQLGLFSFLTSLGLSLIIVFFLLWKRRSFPSLISGLFWFLMTIGPTLGLIRAGNNLTADRYCYLPLLGLLIAFAGIFTTQNRKRNLGLHVVLALCSSVFFIATFQQISTWRNHEVLFRNVLNHQPKNLTAHIQLAELARIQSKITQAEKHLAQALELAPNSPKAHIILGHLAFEKNNYEEAYRCFEIASRIRSREAWLQERLAASAHGSNNMAKARYHLTEALRLSRPSDHSLELERKWRALFPNSPFPH